MAFRFLHLADLHLDTHFGGTEATRERLRKAVIEAWERALGFAVDEGLHAILIAGDAFDDADLDRGVETAFRRGIRRVAEHGVHVAYCCGNHDPGGQNHRAAQLGLEGDEPWQARVHLFRTATPRAVTITDRDGAEVGVVVGVGHAKVGVDTDLVAKLAPRATELPTVGLVHTQVLGAKQAVEHDRYAPSSRESFGAGYDYWALGHVHIRQRVFEDAPAWYAGNLQGRNPSEVGEKGGLVVELERDVPAEPRFVPFAPVVWRIESVEGLDEVTTTHALLDHLEARVDALAGATDGELCLRLVPTGACPLAGALLDPAERRTLEETLTDTTRALEVQLRPRGLRRPRDLDSLRATPSVVAETLALIEALRDEEGELTAFAPTPLAAGDGPHGLEGDARATYLASLLDDLEETFLDHALEADA